MSGREFIMVTWGNGHWEHEGTLRQEWVEDRLENPFSVPDGFWVLRVTTWHDFEYGGCYYQPVGPQPQDLLLDRTQTGVHHLLVGREPFGILQSESHYGELQEGRRLILARQIHKGELGRYPEVPALSVTYRGEQHRRSRQRNKDGWVRLAELAQVTGLSIEAILTNYWPVIDYNVGQDRRRGMEAQIEILMAPKPEWIIDGPSSPLHLSRDEINKRLAMGNEWNWMDTWIRKGVARTIQRLVLFGHDFAPADVPA